ncbi:MAG: RcnB family protein [Pseudoxanthomonas sp.]
MRHAIKSALSLLFVVALAAAPAIAKDHGRGHDRDRDHDRHGYVRSDRDDHRYRRDNDDDRRRYRYSGNDRRYSHDRYYQARQPRVVYRPVYRPAYPQAYYPGRAAPRWARGYRYNHDGYGRTYIVNDYRGYGLRAPPRGQYWRRSDAGDYLLVAVATGLITDLILRN